MSVGKMKFTKRVREEFFSGLALPGENRKQRRKTMSQMKVKGMIDQGFLREKQIARIDRMIADMERQEKIRITEGEE